MLVRPESNSRPPAWQPDAQSTELPVRAVVGWPWLIYTQLQYTLSCSPCPPFSFGISTEDSWSSVGLNSGGLTSPALQLAFQTVMARYKTKFNIIVKTEGFYLICFCFEINFRHNFSVTVSHTLTTTTTTTLFIFYLD